MNAESELVQLTVSYPPYTRSHESIERIMYTVLIALLPAVGTSVYFFGPRALWLTLVTTASCIGFEFLSNKLRKRDLTCFDGSAAITGVLLALNLPSNLPYWMAVVGALVAIIISKELFGGLGYNIFNPALVARVFLLISFPSQMTSWPQPLSVDVVTGASPLGIIKSDGVAALGTIDFWALFAGNMRGSLGETSALAILLGAALLWSRNCISLRIPLSFIGTTVAFTWIFYLIDPSVYAPPLLHLLSGGLMLGAFFMATDMVTSPLAARGQIVFGIGCGLLTALIRLFGGYPEGVSFAILIMNAVVPLIDRWDLRSRSRYREAA
ncbi:MAG: RnfABCDGE type electron transport complex subunit D [Deltaproteobacteria bacterium]|nr:RnfABCDGE type electron transport complex subunit D [Deltaproteobacteria bacterium]